MSNCKINKGLFTARKIPVACCWKVEHCAWNRPNFRLRANVDATWTTQQCWELLAKYIASLAGSLMFTGRSWKLMPKPLVGWKEKRRVFFSWPSYTTTWDHCTGDVICYCMFVGLSFYLKNSEHLLQRKISHRFVFKWNRFAIQNSRQLAHRFERRSQSGFRLFQKKKKLLTTPTNECVSYLQLTNTVYANTNNMATMDTT